MDVLLIIDMQEGLLLGAEKYDLPAVVERINQLMCPQIQRHTRVHIALQHRITLPSSSQQPVGVSAGEIEGMTSSNRQHFDNLCRVFVLVLLVAIVSTGCVQTRVLKNPAAISVPINSARVLVMDADVELSLVTASGLPEPNAQWTQEGAANVASALADLFKDRNVQLIPYQEPIASADKRRDHHQLLKLHEAVGVTILNHKYIEPLALPTKQERFDWSLGPYARDLHEQFDADYALFIFMRDSYASSGRVATIILMAALGVGVQGGVQIGFASIVNLRTGDVVWFNRLIDNTGDLRDATGAHKAINALLTDIPL